jgi:hypothetical protein
LGDTPASPARAAMGYTRMVTVAARCPGSVPCLAGRQRVPGRCSHEEDKRTLGEAIRTRAMRAPTLWNGFGSNARAVAEARAVGCGGATRLFRHSLLLQWYPHKINDLLMTVALCVRDPFCYTRSWCRYGAKHEKLRGLRCRAVRACAGPRGQCL